jgi:hypothetical protein
MDARDTLLAFLHDINPPVVYVESTVEEVVEANFDTFDDKNMRLLIDAALKERDANLKKGGKEEELLGSWGVVIDLIKTTTMSRYVALGLNSQRNRVVYSSPLTEYLSGATELVPCYSWWSTLASSQAPRSCSR